MTVKTVHWRHRSAVALAVVVCFLVPAVPSAASVRPAGPSPDKVAAAPSRTPEEFPSVVGQLPVPPAQDSFYQPPEPLPQGDPGDVIRYRKSTVNLGPLPFPLTAWQMLYLTESATGERIAVSGTVFVPVLPYPGDRPLVAYPPGTQGQGADSMLGYRLRLGLEYEEASVLPPALGLGWAFTMTDYQGAGRDGTHVYGVAPALGRQTLDSARAAQRLPGTGLRSTTPVALWGYSEGGVAATAAAELHSAYAPDLKVVGAALGGGIKNPATTMRYEEGTETFGVSLAVIQGFHNAYPELPYAELMTANGRELYRRIDRSELLGLVFGFPYLRFTDAFTSSPLDDPRWKAALSKVEFGHRKPDLPLFMYHGTADQVLPYADMQALGRDYCRMGVPVDFLTLPLADHFAAYVAGAPPAVAWLTARFAGRPTGRGTCR
ncbi:lipase family protein [Kitasatospora sp. NPDC002040]|uniref:lipase family protein n=1 Tax=Kitasatospora sp. NPDC002040 TaxID=3154661 RepID=UPI00331E967F